MKAFMIFNLLKNFHFHHGWDLCLSNIFYKQISRPKKYEIDQIYGRGEREFPLPFIIRGNPGIEILG